MKKGIWKRILCVATATVVCLTSIPGTVFADETGCKEAKDGKHVPNEDKKERIGENGNLYGRRRVADLLSIL